MTRIAFLGTSSVAIPTLINLSKLTSLTVIFCNPDRPSGRGRHIHISPIKTIANDLKIPCYQPKSWQLVETKELWNSLNIDIAIVVSYGHILPSWMLHSCKRGIWNLHFSLLPRWRGASPVNHAILSGDTETGVSLIKITELLDEGPILAQSKRKISFNDTAEDLLNDLSHDAATLLIDNMDSIRLSKLHLTVQDNRYATIAPKLHKELANIDINNPASTLHRRIRAFHPWPGSKININNNIIKICGVGNIRRDDSQPGTLTWNPNNVWLTANDSMALELTFMQRENKPIQTASQALQFLKIKNKINIS